MSRQAQVDEQRGFRVAASRVASTVAVAMPSRRASSCPDAADGRQSCPGR